MANTSDSFDLSTAVPIDAAPSASAPQASSGFDLSTAKPIEDASVKKETKPDQETDWGRQIALGGRATAQGVVGALTLPSTILAGARNAPAYIANKFFGGHYPYAPSISSGFSDLMTKLGAPTPQTAGENLASAGISGLTGGLAGGGLTGIPGVANAVRSGAAGASGGLSQETAKQVGLPPWLQFAAGLLGSQAPAMGESFARTGGNLIEPLTKAGQQRALGTLLNEQARDPNSAIQNLQSSAPIVPGSFPTAGAASGDIGLLGIEKYARGNNAPAFGERMSEQNLARQKELADIAGTPNDLKSAIKTRGDTADPLYAAAATQSAPIDNEMIALMQRPAMQTAMAKAKELAENNGRTFGMSSSTGPTMLSGQDLQGIKMSLDDMQSTGFSQGIGAHQQRAIQGTNDALKDWMRRNLPAQRQADASFSNLSAPINRMQTLQDFQQKANLTAADPTTGQYFLSPSGFNRGLMAMKDEPMNGVTQADQVRLGSLLKDLEQSQAINGPLLKAPGSDTFQNLSLRQNLGRFAGFGGKPLEALYNLAGSDKAIQGLLTQAMLDPKLAATLMQKAANQKPGLNFRSYDAGTLGGLLGSQP